MPDEVTPASATEILRGALPGILQRGRVVVTPYPFGMSDGDKLRVVSANAVPGVTIEVHYRAVPLGKDAKHGRLPHTPNSDRTVKVEDFPMGGGFVTNLSVVATGAAPLAGQTYVMVQMVRGEGVNAFVMGTLLAGVVTSTQALGWPGSPISTSTEGEPAIRTILGTIPAAAAEINEVVPSGARWELLGFRSTFHASGVVAPRVPTLVFWWPLGNIALSAAQENTTAGASKDYYWVPGVQSQTGLGFNVVVTPLPYPNRRLQNFAIRTVTINLQAGDQWEAPFYEVREWLEVN